MVWSLRKPNYELSTSVLRNPLHKFLDSGDDLFVCLEVWKSAYGSVVDHLS